MNFNTDKTQILNYVKELFFFIYLGFKEIIRYIYSNSVTFSRSNDLSKTINFFKDIIQK